MDALKIPDDGMYVMYLGSGDRRDGDLTDAFHAESISARLVCIDTKIGGPAHNFVNEKVKHAITTAVQGERCAGILISIECRSWSVAHFLPKPNGEPPRKLRDRDHVMGIPDGDGSLSVQVVRGNAESEAAAEIAEAAHMSGKFVIVETPVKRDPFHVHMAKHALQDATGHVYMYDHPAWVRFIGNTGAQVVCADQCMDADKPETAAIKSTAWLATPNILPHVYDEFAHVQCDHPDGTHKAARGMNAHGAYNTVGTEAYSAKTNLRIARCVKRALASMAEVTYVTCYSGSSVEGMTYIEHGELDVMMVAGVIHGRRLTAENVTWRFMHRITNHRQSRQVKLLHHAWSDADPSWANKCVDMPCDSCMRGEAPMMGPTGHLPEGPGIQL